MVVVPQTDWIAVQDTPAGEMRCCAMSGDFASQDSQTPAGCESSCTMR